MESLFVVASRSRTRGTGRVAPLVLICVAAVSAASCSNSPGSLELKSVKLGTAVDAEERVVTPTREFAAGDTVFVAIGTEGDGSRILHVQWFAGTQEVGSDSRRIRARGERSFAFRF